MKKPPEVLTPTPSVVVESSWLFARPLACRTRKSLVSHRGKHLRPMQNLRRLVVMLVQGDRLSFFKHRHVVHPFRKGQRRLVDAAYAMHLWPQKVPEGYEVANLACVPAARRTRGIRTPLHDAPPPSARSLPDAGAGKPFPANVLVAP
jgi:hypothetical protein